MSNTNTRVDIYRRDKVISRLGDLCLQYVDQVIISSLRDICAEDYAKYFPGFFYINNVNKGLTAIKRTVIAKRIPPLNSARYNNGQREIAKLNQIPNDEFASSIQNWLLSLPEETREKEVAEILDNLDISAALTAIEFGMNEGKHIFAVNLGERCGIPYTDVIDKARAVRLLRNAVIHRDENNKRRFNNPQEWHDSLSTIESFISIIENTNSQPTLEAIAECKKEIQNARKDFEYPIIYIPEIEKKHDMQEESMLSVLRDDDAYSAYRKNLFDKYIIFTSEKTIARIIGSIKFSKQAMQETNVVPDTELTFSEEDTSLAFPHLSKYNVGEFNSEQLRELVCNFALFADIGTWLSVWGQDVISDILIPVLEKEKRQLHVEWGTLVNIYRLINEGETAEIRENARVAKKQIFHMHTRGWIRYVGSKNCHPDPNKSLLQLLHANSDIPICVITADAALAKELQQSSRSLCFCTKLWMNFGLYPYKESNERLPIIAQELMRMREEKAAEEKKQKEINSEDNREEKKENIPTQSYPANTTREKGYQYRIEAVVSQHAIIPTEGSMILTESGEVLYLTEAKGEPGGEGTVYYTSRPGFLAKIYFQKRITNDRYEKLKAMRKIALDIPNVCWPVSILTNKRHQFVGFLMPAAPEDALEISMSAFKLNGENIRKYVLPEWDRISLIRCCLAVADTFAELHQKGILMGDVNPRNIMVSKSDPAAVFFVDCDSYQVGEHLCTVGMPEYSSPEMLRRVASTAGGYASCPRTEKDEQFSLATLLFQILMFGMSPFAAKDNENISDAIRGYHFSFKHADDAGYNAPPGPYPLIWSNTASWIKNMFARVFLGKETYSAHTWGKQLSGYLRDASSGKFTNELAPTKYPDYDGVSFVDYICCECKETVNMHVDSYAKLKNQPKFCRNCREILNRGKKTPSNIICDGCGQEHSARLYDVLMQEHGQAWYCSTCKTLECADCGEPFPAAPWQIERRLSGNLVYPRCPACHKKWKEHKK